MVKITFNGACREVGRSAILIESEKTTDKILLDYGIKMSGKDENFPLHVSGKDLSAICITHSHIDHLGGVPIFYISGAVPLYVNSLTHDISQVLLRDMMNISEFFLPFDRHSIKRMRKYIRNINFKSKKKIGENSYITFYNAGHVPGSAMILVEMDDKKILYTGDMNSSSTQLMLPAIPPQEKIDVLITESTYGTTDHEPREVVEKKFINEINTVLDNNGKVLVPAFGVSRSQEIAMVLNKYGINKPIFMDGIARKISRIYNSYKNYYRSWSEMVAAFDNTHFIIQRNSFHERVNAKNTNGVVIAPSGMLKGGTARMYAENLLKDPNSAIFLVSYQIPGTPGSVLLNEKKYALNSKKPEETEDVLAQVEFFDFSSHSGRNELVNFAENCEFTNPEQKYAFAVHGDEEVSVKFADELKSKGFISKAPQIGEEFKI